MMRSGAPRNKSHLAEIGPILKVSQCLEMARMTTHLFSKYPSYTLMNGNSA